MRCLVVIAHPLPDSLCRALAAQTVAGLIAAGHVVEIENLYDAGFAPALTTTERRSYDEPAYAGAEVQAQIDRLLQAEALILCFPTWWFGFPAILKGWFDRVWAPGIAYDHGLDRGPIQPRLHGLRHVLAITTLGSPRWVDWLVMRRPVRRILKTALLRPCAPRARLQMLSLYAAETATPAQIAAFGTRILNALPRG
jgi:NAD(P)H dehydrogenase (quinone)